MELAFIGAGACFANIVEDILTKCETKQGAEQKWRLLNRALRRPPDGGPTHRVHYVDCGPELSRSQKRGQVFTYDISEGGLLSGAGNVATGIRFWRSSAGKTMMDLKKNADYMNASIVVSIRGGGATNCGAGFLMDREVLQEFRNAVLIQFVILPHRGEGIEASRVVYLARQVVELQRLFPDRYAPVILSNDRILSAAQSFQQAGINWFYPLANTIVADVIVRILYPTLYEALADGEPAPGKGDGFELDSRQKYLDVRDFVRQPGMRGVAYAHEDDAGNTADTAVKKMVASALGNLRVSRVPDTDDLAMVGSLAPIQSPITAFTLLTGPRGELGDMTKITLTDALETALPGAFARAYVYDITPGRYELLLFPGGGMPDDLKYWLDKFERNTKNPRYRDLVAQSTYDYDRIVTYHGDVLKSFEGKLADGSLQV